MKKKSSKKEESSNVISPWSIFVDVYKPIYMEQNPNESKMEIYKMLKAKWESFDEDDKNMIENAKLGIAMEGSSPNIIKIADVITRK